MMIKMMISEEAALIRVVSHTHTHTNTHTHTHTHTHTGCIGEFALDKAARMQDLSDDLLPSAVGPELVQLFRTTGHPLNRMIISLMSALKAACVCLCALLVGLETAWLCVCVCVCARV
jgi:hypothetical protein